METIKIQTRDGVREVEADVRGPLAVHPALSGNGFTPTDIALSHVPSGFAVTRFLFPVGTQMANRYRDWLLAEGFFAWAQWKDIPRGERRAIARMNSLLFAALTAEGREQFVIELDSPITDEAVRTLQQIGYTEPLIVCRGCGGKGMQPATRLTGSGAWKRDGDHWLCGDCPDEAEAEIVREILGGEWEPIGEPDEFPEVARG